MNDPKHILITGGSSGIGEALIYYYSKPGVMLSFSGRNQERLDQVAHIAENLGAKVNAKIIDVANKEAMDQWIKEVDALQPLDLVIANAGIGIGKKGDLTVAEVAEKTFEVNVNGVFYTMHPTLELMAERGYGQIAIMASIAGLIGMPGYGAYSASKNAVRAYGEAMRGPYALKGVEINVICPGFVVSRMTDQNKFKMPFLMTGEKAAKIIATGLKKNKARIGFPFGTYGAVRLMQILPIWLKDFIMEPKK